VLLQQTPCWQWPLLQSLSPAQIWPRLHLLLLPHPMPQPGVVHWHCPKPLHVPIEHAWFGSPPALTGAQVPSEPPVSPPMHELQPLHALLQQTLPS
jgi:hypothetical protein